MVGVRPDDELIAVGQHALQTGASIADEHWDGTEEEELSCFVSEVSGLQVERATELTVSCATFTAS